ncbi:UbiA family prenyltransferase [Nesterenkonia pannonica]|uniref:UbiA family prenyltransferase n=1 Tax=Nesterenkonia pannonica TaxID=1548602 RepID=UPI002164DF75|nr:UbiA family prenyltransferase [Nesterenkonia pannonica]
MERASESVLGALWKSSHPGPTLVVTALAGLLAVSAELELWRGAVLTAAVFAGQLSVGLSNDALDAERDRAVGRTDKPIARGVISVRTAWAATWTCLALALLLSAPLGVGLLLAHAVALASAWSYNAGLKATPLSVLPYMVTFGIFPSLLALAAESAQFAGAWVWCTGAALGVALHFTNVLPDLDDDARTGIRGLPHRLGGQISAVSASAAVVVGAAAATLGPAQWNAAEVPVVSWALCAAVIVLAVVTVAVGRGVRAGRLQFRLVMLAALILAVQLILSGGSLTA